MSRYIDAEILPTLFNEKFKETQMHTVHKEMKKKKLKEISKKKD